MSSTRRDDDLQEETFTRLLAGAQAGDGHAWESLYRWLAPSVAGYLRVQGAVGVDDLTSEVFLALVRSIASFRGGAAQFRSFVFVIAHRRLQDEHRREGRHAERMVPLDHAPMLPGGDVHDDAFSRLAGERVLALCDGLAPDQRDVILLRVVGDLTVEQVAAVVGKTTGAVKALQRRGFEQIRKILSREAVPL